MNSRTFKDRTAQRQASSTSWAIETFTDRNAWIELLLADTVSALSATSKIVATRIALHHNVETGQCNPGIVALSRGTGMSESTVRRMLRELEEKGWVRVDRTRGRHCNSFELQAPTLSASDRVQDSQPCQNEVPNPVKFGPTLSPGERQKKESRTENRTEKDIDSPRFDLGEDSGRRSQSPSSDIHADFEAWYRQYPKHAAKMAAFKAYCAAMNKKLATPADLLSGAMRYAAERSGQDPKYTKHPATWLNSGCWSDEPSAPITSTIDANGNQIRPPPDRRQQAAYGPQLASALAAARRLSEKGGDQ